MAKCESYNPSPNPKYAYEKYGAALSKSGGLPNAASYTGNIWSELSYCFNSGNSENVKLSLYNAENKGTVYFSNFKLEEITEDSNKWNLCVVFFKNIKASIVQDGKKTTLNSKLSQEDIEYCTGQINQLYSLINRMSEGRMDVKSIDFYECDKAITSLTCALGGAYSLNRKDKVYKETLDTIIANTKKNSGKRYDHFVILSPLTTDIAGKYGVGDILYQNIHLCEVYINPSENMKTVVPTCVHEILHSVEGVSKRMDPNTVELHAINDEYSEYYHAWQNGLPGNCTWFSDYMRKATHDGRGLNEDSFYSHGKLIYANGKTVKSSSKTTYKTTDVGTLKISAISDRTYTGKEIMPTVTVKNGKTKLTLNKDYTVSYICNTDIGLASVIIKGKGKYSGTVKKNFNIVPPKPVLSTELSGNSYKLSWKASKGADGYIVYISTGGKYNLYKTIDSADTTSLTVPSKGKNYTFKIKAYKEVYPQTFYSKEASNA